MTDLPRPSLTRSDLVRFLRAHRWSVVASVSRKGTPQAALVGFIVTDDLELFFDSLTSSRKASNLRARPDAAFVVGGWTEGEERTVQLEGPVDEPKGEELRRLQRIYFNRFPDGQDRSQDPDISYFRARPAWVRYSDYTGSPPIIAERALPSGDKAP